MIHVIYHDKCYDGFCAAWVAYKAITRGRIRFTPASYGDKLPGYPTISDGDEVYILDFSYPRDVLIELESYCAVWVLDHHKTAQANCEGLEFCTFDMNRSGAGLTWDYFFPGRPRPLLVDAMEDRDLWKFEKPYTKEIFSAVASYPMDFDTWVDIDQSLTHNASELINEGRAILRYDDQKVEELLQDVQWKELEGPAGVFNRVPVLNIPYSYGSKACHRLLELYPEAPYSAYYLIRGNGDEQWGLRGRDSDDFDVSEVATFYGGGGHKKASGFLMNRRTRG